MLVSEQPVQHEPPTIRVGRIYFEDLEVGRSFDDAPAITLTPGHAAFHSALFGDRLRLPLDSTLCTSVTGQPALAHPNLACNLAIGQTTEPTQLVKGNLFYRGLVLRTPVFIGDTLRTRSEVVAVRQNKKKAGRAATGMVVLQVHVENQHGATVLHFWRCAMLPCRDPNADTGANDSLDSIPDELPTESLACAIPPDWDLDHYRDALPGAHFSDVSAGTHYVIDSHDTVTSAPELARMTMNMACAHTDAAASIYGRRLVYGGHTISMAGAQITRALPNLVTFVGWRSCAHLAPVFEGDRLRTELRITSTHRLERAGGLVDLHATVYADGGERVGEAEGEVGVLDWRVVALMA